MVVKQVGSTYKSAAIQTKRCVFPGAGENTVGATWVTMTFLNVHWFQGEGGEDVFIMSVREHKTGSEGYINHIGPLIDPQHKIDRLSVLSGPRKLTNMHSYIQAVGKKNMVSVLPLLQRWERLDQQLCGCSVGRLNLTSSPDNCLTQYTHTANIMKK